MEAHIAFHVLLGLTTVVCIVWAIEERERAHTWETRAKDSSDTVDRLTHELVETKRLEKEWFTSYQGASAEACMAKRGDLRTIGKMHAAWVTSVGWGKESFLESLAMIGSEITEAKNEADNDPLVMEALFRVEQACARAVNAARIDTQHKVNPEFAIELADIVLRVACLAHNRGIDLVAAIEEKMRRNQENGNKGRAV
jgi:NTP pyrophosphatase (non-canonical NTP hydrolase)